MTEAALSRQVEAELGLFEYPAADWVRPVRGPDGTPVKNVVIVGGGQAGLTVAFGLRQERISGVVVLDENPDGLEGPWITYARMITLRTLKFLTGPDLGVPSLTFRRWHAARYGDDAWDRLVRIDKADWMKYLVWFRRTLNLPVHNNTRLARVEPAGGLWSLHLETQSGPEILLTREVVLATGLEGAGARRVPDFVRTRLPPGTWAHTADAIDFVALAGRRVAVMGGGSSAYDNAATALEHGAATVDMFIRRDTVPMINPYRALESNGFWGNFADLDDAARWRFMHRLMSFPMPPPQDSVERVTRHKNARLHFGTSILDAEPGLRLRTPSGWHEADFLILGTGFGANLEDRPELSVIARHIATWRDRHVPPPGKTGADMARYPYVGPGYELIEKTPGTMPGLRRIRMFNAGALVSSGPTATGLNGMPFGLPRLIRHISCDFLRDQAMEFLEEFETYDEPDAWETVRTTEENAP
ncbi:MAG: NAD(P)/FAD-dependent oxidoreductase [Acetobacteraceae bacterium]|nr:NAD(P)/FAD-dependent oxidoreductase [Acetobacteraceae bacterium]